MSAPLKNIVISTSLTEESDDAVRTGVALARRTGASPWLIHACSPLLGTPEMGVDAVWMEVQMKGLKEMLDEQVQRTGLAALPGFVPGQVHLVLGSPHREIVELARRTQADLIVVGAAEPGHGLLGSTADRVIRKAPCPVLAVRSGVAFPPTRVEIPVDGSPISAHALRRGLEILDQLRVPAEGMEALFVLNPLEAGGSLHFDLQQVERFAGEVLRRVVKENVSAGAGAPSTRVRVGYPRAEILAAIDERKADLAVLGTHGRSGFERLMLGSVAIGVLHGAGCNVLVVPPEARDTTKEHREERTGADWIYVSDEAPAADAQLSPSKSPGEYWFG